MGGPDRATTCAALQARQPHRAAAEPAGRARHRTHRRGARFGGRPVSAVARPQARPAVGTGSGRCHQCAQAAGRTHGIRGAAGLGGDLESAPVAAARGCAAAGAGAGSQPRLLVWPALGRRPRPREAPASRFGHAQARRPLRQAQAALPALSTLYAPAQCRPCPRPAPSPPRKKRWKSSAWCATSTSPCTCRCATRTRPASPPSPRCRTTSRPRWRAWWWTARSSCAAAASCWCG
mmetsp:Transcript_21566/g.83901  ORF Transcript_21566/g.83901 Transcript_21566/m.83901 type:complete len:235 (+) Transcript_21566:560-1264(+)